MSAAHCQGNVREFQSVWRVVTLNIPAIDMMIMKLFCQLIIINVYITCGRQKGRLSISHWRVLGDLGATS